MVSRVIQRLRSFSIFSIFRAKVLSSIVSSFVRSDVSAAPEPSGGSFIANALSEIGRFTGNVLKKSLLDRHFFKKSHTLDIDEPPTFRAAHRLWRQGKCWFA